MNRRKFLTGLAAGAAALAAAPQALWALTENSASQLINSLVGDINRFDADHLGRIVLEVQWGVADADGAMTLPVRRNRYQAQAAAEGGPGAVAAAMNDALAKFSRDIASKIETAL